jgi:hypothetical protein
VHWEEIKHGLNHSFQFYVSRLTPHHRKSDSTSVIWFTLSESFLARFRQVAPPSNRTCRSVSNLKVFGTNLDRKPPVVVKAFSSLQRNAWIRLVIRQSFCNCTPHNLGAPSSVSRLSGPKRALAVSQAVGLHLYVTCY